MNCRDIGRLLAKGQALSEAAEKHVRQCEGCRSLLDALATPEDQIYMPPAPNFVPGMLGNLLPGMSSAKPLPADRVLIVLTAAANAVFCLLIASVVGLNGFLHLSVEERVIYYGAVVVFDLLLSVAAVQCAIPGAKVRVHRGWVMAGSVLVAAFAVVALFRNFAVDHFVEQGIPCLRLGCICAACFGVLAVLTLRKGYVTNIGATFFIIGCFAGFSGVAVLSLHCPLQNATHIIVWHIGAAVVSMTGALVLGLIKHKMLKLGVAIRASVRIRRPCKHR